MKLYLITIECFKLLGLFLCLWLHLSRLLGSLRRLLLPFLLGLFRLSFLFLLALEPSRSLVHRLRQEVDLSLDGMDPWVRHPNRQVYLLSWERLVRLFGSSCRGEHPLVGLSSLACLAQSCLGSPLGLCQEERSCCMIRLLFFNQGTCSFLFYHLVYLDEDHRGRSRVPGRSRKAHDRRAALGNSLVHADA